MTVGIRTQTAPPATLLSRRQRLRTRSCREPVPALASTSRKPRLPAGQLKHAHGVRSRVGAAGDDRWLRAAGAVRAAPTPARRSRAGHGH
jgi:hypothetical protein